MGDPCIVRLSENWVPLALAYMASLSKLTLQDMSLRGGGLACTLKRATVDEVHNNAVRELLEVLIGTVGSFELREVIALGDTLRIRNRWAHD